jgi:hypothetical protein
MSLFTETAVKLSLNKSEEIQKIAVSNTTLSPSIAVSTQNRIILFNELGEKQEYELSRNLNPCSIEWHP